MRLSSGRFLPGERAGFLACFPLDESPRTGRPRRVKVHGLPLRLLFGRRVVAVGSFIISRKGYNAAASRAADTGALSFVSPPRLATRAFMWAGTSWAARFVLRRFFPCVSVRRNSIALLSRTARALVHLRPAEALPPSGAVTVLHSFRRCKKICSAPPTCDAGTPPLPTVARRLCYAYTTSGANIAPLTITPRRPQL